MPAEQSEVIHGLFDSHDKFQREVTPTETGYISKTTSDDPEAVKLIQTHVKQMEGRLKEGLMVRAWDPAYVEFVNHYDDIDIKITNIENGISIVATGKTEDARKVARNHAGIISKFIAHGWEEHDRTHATALSQTEDTQTKETLGGMSCCQRGDGETALADLECSVDGEASCMMETKSAQGGPSCCQHGNHGAKG
jgi:hypothetical protein